MPYHQKWSGYATGPNIVYFFDANQTKLLSLSGSEPYDPEEVNQQYLKDCGSWIALKERIGHSGQNLRWCMVTPWAVNEPISAEEFQQQTQIMKEVKLAYITRISK